MESHEEAAVQEEPASAEDLLAVSGSSKYLEGFRFFSNVISTYHSCLSYIRHFLPIIICISVHICLLVNKTLKTLAILKKALWRLFHQQGTMYSGVLHALCALVATSTALGVRRLRLLEKEGRATWRATKRPQYKRSLLQLRLF